MDRRQLLSAVGGSVVGLTLGDGNAAAAHPDAAAKNPMERMQTFLCAFHTAKKDSKFVVEAYHYCSMVSEEVHQCVIFESSAKNARLLGVEYIITDKLYRKLPDAEKKYYHPHTYEIISGLLIAPGMAKADEKKLMEGLLTTWGKTWHTWPDPKTDLPMGDPLLMWAATKDGQIPEAMLAARDEQFKVSTPEIRKRRQYLGPVPQIDAPKSIDDLGRQWTNSGPDLPKRP